MKRISYLASLFLVALFSTSALAAPPHGRDATHEHRENSIGVPGKATQVARTVNVDMGDDMRFRPSKLTARQGETVRFVVRNRGKLKHEFVLGTRSELKEHYALMKKFPNMEHDEPNMLTLESGKTGQVIWKFTRAGTVLFACLQPGHYDAGMKGEIAVSHVDMRRSTQPSHQAH